MNRQLRSALFLLFAATAGSASAGVITQDGVVFTTTYTGKVLTLEIDAAGRTGGWAGATAIDALGIKTIGNFDNVTMASPGGAAWTNASTELNAAGCGRSSGGKAKTAGGGRLCYTGSAIELADNMVFTFTFDGTPTLSAPHLKVHFVNAAGSKVGSLLSMDFPWQAETVPTPPASGGQQGGAGASGSDEGADTGTPGGATEPVSEPVSDPVLIPAPVLTEPVDAPAQDEAIPPPAAGGGPADIPEPQSLAIVGAGLAVMGLSRRKRKHKHKQA
ncbi:PEP-CTERM sorting domain-containing protein [Massilia sp. UMI-21]|nr:PEP-CTERM sorting domain-containing protein [Massilia sp. UMI-21]